MLEGKEPIPDGAKHIIQEYQKAFASAKEFAKKKDLEFRSNMNKSIRAKCDSRKIMIDTLKLKMKKELSSNFQL